MTRLHDTTEGKKGAEAVHDQCTQSILDDDETTTSHALEGNDAS